MLIDSKGKVFDPAQVGGKASSLGRLKDVGVSVPQYFVLTTATHERFLRDSNLVRTLDKFTKALGDTTPNQLRYVSSRLQQVIKAKARFSPALNKVLKAAWDDLDYSIPSLKPVAVRSSAVDEDSQTDSFAGQHSTALGVRTFAEFKKSVVDCYISLYTSRALSYRRERNLSLSNLYMAVVVQKMVNPRVSGVMFTVDPISGRRVTIVEAVRGLGEALVSGFATPDHYEIDKGKIVQFFKGKQEKILRQSIHGGSGVQWIDNSYKTIFSKPKAISLASLGAKVEAKFGGPQDIEWAWENGIFYLLQARPITVTGNGKKAAKSKIKPLLTGLPAGSGIGSGPVKVITNYKQLGKIRKGDVLVTSMTTPEYMEVFPKLSGLVTDLGGSTCHAAIVSREYNLPCVVGTGKATQTLAGKRVKVNGDFGEVYNFPKV